MWPDYCKKETLARRLDLEIGAVDQYVKRGLLPSPHKVGEALLFCWQEVDSYLRGGNTAESEHVDPYDAGARRAAEAAASRRPGPKQGRTALSVSDEVQGHAAGREGHCLHRCKNTVRLKRELVNT